jgi:hypothetical protein
MLFIILTCSVLASLLAAETSTEPKKCSIEIKQILSVEGTCVKLLGGAGACRASGYLQPFDPKCNE